jgi:diacylglycerol O-acyltransferase / wax synthase
MYDQLSPLDTMFLELEEADDGANMHMGAALVFDPLHSGGAPGIERMRAHLAERLAALPRYRERLSSPRTSGLSWLRWEPASQFDIADHVAHATLPAPGGEAELEAWLGDFWSHRLDRRRPLWETVLLDGLPEGRWAMVTKTHHCLVDGMGSVDVGRILLDADPTGGALVATPAQVPAGHGSWLPAALLMGGAHAVRHPAETLKLATAAVDLLIRDELIAAPASSLNGPLGATRSFAAVRFTLDELKAIEHELGGTLNDVVLAVSAGALRRLLLARGETPPAAGLRAQIPVDIRDTGRRSLGNELTSLFVELPVAEPDPLVRYARIAERTAQRKAGSQAVGGKTLVDLAGLAPPVLGLALGRVMFGGHRLFNLTITNVRGSAAPLYAFGAPLREVLPYLQLWAWHTIGIAAASYAGGLVFGLSADRTSVPDLDVLADGLGAAYEELRATTTLPSSSRAAKRRTRRRESNATQPVAGSYS